MGELYNKISTLCNDKGVTGYRMCKDIGIQPSIMSDLKSGRKKSLSADYANRIATYFGVSVPFLLGEETEKPADPKIDGLSDYELRLLAWFRSLPPEKRRAILEIGDGPKEQGEGETP